MLPLLNAECCLAARRSIAQSTEYRRQILADGGLPIAAAPACTVDRWVLEGTGLRPVSSPAIRSAFYNTNASLTRVLPIF